MIYFTVVPSEKSGFTDQLLQLTVLMTIGKSLNFRFYHTKLVSVRSSGILENHGSGQGKEMTSGAFGTMEPPSKYDLLDIYDFLGINEYLHSISSPLDGQPIVVPEIKLSDELLRTRQISSYGGLLTYISSLTDCDSCHRSEIMLVRLSVEGQRTFYKYVVDDIRFQKFALNFGKIYNQTRKNLPHPSLFSGTNGKKVLVHVRQGDISVIRTPWRTYIPVDKRIEGWMGEFHDIAEIKSLRDVNQLLFPDDFRRFLSSFHECIEPDGYEMLLFSDGYERAFQMIFGRLQTFRFNEVHKQALINSSEKYNDEIFKDFDALPNCRRFVGESVNQLFDLVDSVINADVVVVGVQQRMIVKLIAQFCPDSGPVVIVLFRTERPDFSNIHPRDQERFIYVDINHYHTGEIRERIQHDSNILLQKSLRKDE
mgnify:CR=1 FL=1